MSGAETNPHLIEAIPPEFLKVIPVTPPPPGVTPNFEHPTTRVPNIIGVSTVFLAIAIACFSMRIHTKIKIAQRWSWDDITITLGFMCSIVYYGFVLDGVINGSFGKHEYETHLDEALKHRALRAGIVTTILITPALGLIKCSLFLQYYALFSTLRWLKIAVWIGASISCLFYIPTTVAALALCIPRARESYLEAALSRHALVFVNFSIPTGVVGTFIDWYLFILPIPAVMGLNLTTAKKLGVILVFMTGGVAALASTMNLYYRIDLQVRGEDYLYKAGYVWMFNLLEQFAGVAASSMPAVRHFYIEIGVSPLSLMSTLRNSSINLWNRSSSRGHGTSSTSFSSTERTSENDITIIIDESRHGTAKQYRSPPPETRQTGITVTKDICVIREAPIR